MVLFFQYNLCAVFPVQLCFCFRRDMRGHYSFLIQAPPQQKQNTVRVFCFCCRTSVALHSLLHQISSSVTCMLAESDP